MSQFSLDLFDRLNRRLSAGGFLFIYAIKKRAGDKLTRSYFRVHQVNDWVPSAVVGTPSAIPGSEE